MSAAGFEGLFAGDYEEAATSAIHRPHPPDGTLPKPPEGYVRPQPSWLIKALAQKELDDERLETLGVAQQLSAASTTVFLKSHVASEVAGSTPRIARVNAGSDVSKHRRVSKQQVVPLPSVRSERTRMLAAALSLSPRVVASGPKAQLLLTTTPSALRNGAVESMGGRADANKITSYSGTAKQQLQQATAMAASSSSAMGGSQSARRVGERGGGRRGARDPSQLVASSASQAPSSQAPAAAAERPPLSEALRRKLSSELTRVIDLFRAADGNEDGSISMGEFRETIASAGLGATDEELSALFHLIDADGSDSIEFKELNRVLRKALDDGGPPVVPPAPPLPKMSSEAAEITSNLAIIQALVREHEGLRHKIRQTRIKASLRAERAKQRAELDQGEPEDEVPLHLRDEVPTFNASAIAAIDTRAGDSIAYGSTFGGGVSVSGIGGGSSIGGSAAGSRMSTPRFPGGTPRSPRGGGGSKGGRMGGGGGGGGVPSWDAKQTRSFPPGSSGGQAAPTFERPFKRRTQLAEVTVAQREEAEQMDLARIPAEERTASLAQKLSEKKQIAASKQRKLEALQLELTQLTREHDAALVHERYGLDDVHAARSAHEVRAEEQAHEEHYQRILEHMQHRLIGKRAHYEKRLVRMRSNLIAVAEQTRLMQMKLGHAESSKRRAETKCEATRLAGDRARTEHYQAKQELREQLRASGKAPPTPPSPEETPPPGLSGRELQALANQRAQGAAVEGLLPSGKPDDGKSEDSSARARLTYLEGVWDGLSRVCSADDAEGFIEFWETTTEANRVLENSQVEIQQRLRELELERSACLNAEDQRQQNEAEAESGFSGDKELQTAERALALAEKRLAKSQPKAVAAELLYKQVCEQLHLAVEHVSSVTSRGRPAERASATTRNAMMRQQMLLEKLFKKHNEAQGFLVNPPKEWVDIDANARQQRLEELQAAARGSSREAAGLATPAAGGRWRSGERRERRAVACRRGC